MPTFDMPSVRIRQLRDRHFCQRFYTWSDSEPEFGPKIRSGAMILTGPDLKNDNSKMTITDRTNKYRTENRTVHAFDQMSSFLWYFCFSHILVILCHFSNGQLLWQVDFCLALEILNSIKNEINTFKCLIRERERKALCSRKVLFSTLF